MNAVNPTSNNIASKKLPPVRDLDIDGIEKQNINETRLASLKAMNEQKTNANKPAGTKKLAEIFKQQQEYRKQQEKILKPEYESSFRVVETNDLSLGIMMASKTVQVGLARGETVVVVSPQDAEQIRCKLEMTGLDIQSSLENKKLVLLSTESDVDTLWNEKTYYKGAFEDLFKKVGGSIDRVIILEMNQILDLSSQQSSYTSMNKLTRVMTEMNCKVIAQYVRNHSKEYDHLDAACSSLVPAYFVMNRTKQAGKYRLQGKNHPV